MIDQYVFNEMNNIAVNIKALPMLDKLALYKNVAIVSDDSLSAYYLCAGIALVKGKMEKDGLPFPNVSIVIEDGLNNKEYQNYLKKNISSAEIYNNIDEYMSKHSLSEKSIVFRFVNLKDKKYDNVDRQAETLQKLDNLMQKTAENSESIFQLVAIIPDIGSLPTGILGVSEREYEVIFSNKGEKSREKYLIKLEDVLRKYAEKISVNCARVDNIFAPLMSEIDSSLLDDVIDEAKASNSITIYENDCKEYFSAVYITQACMAMLQIALFGRKGNIYNVSSWHFTRYDIKSTLYSLFSHLNLELKYEKNSASIQNTYHILNPKKILLINTPSFNKKQNSITLKSAIHMTALARMCDYDNFVTEPIDVYYGKIDIIRELEMQTLLEVDRICRENNIKYFLAGGTMLGAVRHKGFIPWDDDVDIAMLASEYEKFMKVCPPNLSVEHLYQTTSLEPTSLYTHDKIRLKGTFFSTKYSDQFLMENGVYIDVFIYYKTSDNVKKQERHIRQIHIMRRLLGMRWVNYPRSNIHYTLSKIALPFMRLFSTKTFKKWYEKLIGKYEKKNTNSLLDSTGLNLEKVKAFPKEWFDEFIEGEFEGHKFPILARYDDYLKHWYGKNYMSLLPISARTSVHSVVRIDLGKYILPDGEKIKNLHKEDLRGELYEKYSEI